MASGIYLLGEDDRLVELNQKDYDSEALLQELLESYPALMPGAEINRDNPRQWLLVKREVSIPAPEGDERWSADHLFLDQDAIPTIVEVKRASDTRIRREVVGQMLDYAANAVAYWPVERLMTLFESTCREEGLEPEDRLSEFLGHEGTETFWEGVKTNLQAGKIRLIFVADRIPSELRQIIEFLNSQMDPAEVLGVEISQYAGQGLKALVPKVVGQTAKAQVRKSSGKREYRTWDRESFLADLGAKAGEGSVEIAARLLQWAESRGAVINWGSGKQDGSFAPWVRVGDSLSRTFALYSYGSVEVQFQFMESKPPFIGSELRNELRDRLNQIPGVSIPEDKLSHRPSFKVMLLQEAEAYKMFIDAFELFIDGASRLERAEVSS